MRKRAQLLLQPLSRARIIAGLLLACLAWGATVELNHHHGLRSITSIKQIKQSDASVANDDPKNTQVVQSSDPQGTNSKSKTGTDCTICQLHQNLSATLFSHPPRLGHVEITTPRLTTTVVAELSPFTPNQRGRAPPSIL